MSDRVVVRVESMMNLDKTADWLLGPIPEPLLKRSKVGSEIPRAEENLNIAEKEPAVDIQSMSTELNRDIRDEPAVTGTPRVKLLPRRLRSRKVIGSDPAETGANPALYMSIPPATAYKRTPMTGKRIDEMLTAPVQEAGANVIDLDTDKQQSPVVALMPKEIVAFREFQRFTNFVRQSEQIRTQYVRASRTPPKEPEFA